MPNAENGMVQHPAHVYLKCLETHTSSVNQSAPSTQNVQQTKLVSTRSVWIPAQGSAARMQLAELRIITQFAPVIRDTPEIHLDSAQELPHVCKIIFILGI